MPQNDQEMPVYLFLGFLESGKTKFIQETLEDKRFNSGERTLVLVCEEVSRRSDQFAIVSVNISNFKNVNDTMGHDTGDKMLIEIAGRWKKLALSGDTGTEDFVARLLGEECAKHSP